MSKKHALVLAVPVAEVVGPDGPWKSSQPDAKWLFDLVSNALNGAGFRTLPAVQDRPGSNHVPIVGRGRTFKCIVFNLNPILICEVPESRTLGETLRRAAPDPQFAEAFNAVLTAVRADGRVCEVVSFSGPKKDADAFVRASMEKLERALGIYSD